MTALRLCIFACRAALLTPIALAQSSNGYLIAGAGSLDHKLISHGALGGELVIGQGFGVGGEIGVVAGHYSFAAFSINGYYHLLHSALPRKLDVFITGGYTAESRLFGFANIGNAGLGLNYWFHRHLGVRAEFRDFVTGDGQAAVFRGGIEFR
jgi:hypothetical protein